MLEGRALERFEAPRLVPPFPTVGVVVTAVEARGKHLLVRFSDGLVLHTHLRMSGSWHLYRPGAPWSRDPRGLRALIGVADAVAVCFDAPTVELLDRAAVERHPRLRLLGPDLTAADPDLDAALARMSRSADPDATIGDVLLDQRIAAGTGNVYRCEVCFLHRLHPATPLRAVAPDDRRGLLATASRLLRDNLDTARRTTVPGAPDGTVYVYGRAGRPCRRCGTPVRFDRLGVHHRDTYWCPGCQPDVR